MSQMKILFLDIDGVVNHQEFYKRRENDETLKSLPYPLCEFDPLVVDRINYILDETNSKLVISSSWRFNEHLQNIFDNVGFKHKIYDITPYGMGKCRGHEIKEWLNKHTDVTNYVIIDDDSDMLKEQKKHFIRTSELTGLTSKLTEKAIKILNE